MLIVDYILLLPWKVWIISVLICVPMWLVVDDILLLPWKGLMGIFRRIHDTAKRETSDEKYWLEKLLELQLRYEMDEISEEEYNREEAKLQAKLNDLREADEE